MKIDFERVPACPLCGRTEARTEFTRVFAGDLFRWVRCDSCSVVYQQPKLTRQSLAAIYNSSAYWMLSDGKRSRTGYGNYLATAPGRTAQARDRARLLAELVRPGARLLDVGCAAGFFVQAASLAGLEAQGLELSRVMADYGRQRLGLEIRCGDLFDLPPGTFEAVTAWGLDSNFHDPRRAYQQMAALLTPQGVLAFNFFDYEHWTRPLLGEFKKARNALYFLGRRHVIQLVEDSGLTVERVDPEWHHTTLGEIFHQTGRPFLRRLVDLLGIGRRVLLLPVPGSYLLVARKR